MCTLTTGFGLDCKTSSGGLKKVYLQSKGDSEFTFLDGEVTAIPDSGDWYEYDLQPQTANFDEPLTFNRDNSTIFYTQTITMKLHRLSSAKRNELIQVAQARIWAIVVDANDNYLLCGFENGLDLSTRTASTGTALGDFNGYDLALTHEAPNPAYHLTAPAIADISIA
ncbi:hypothetical protein UFOVP636_8 [uncultured Caudovirales phage]|uniref:Uncharacterized protein n=1 Tax=uncultured Caudovirales phage TaxID=2100421 RepID=A0A6J5N464_9CAUD|nr:hypothetical protein UFOVP636_8 [uncultured Caudovirales phage]